MGPTRTASLHPPPAPAPAPPIRIARPLAGWARVLVVGIVGGVALAPAPAAAEAPPSDRIGVARSGQLAGHGELGMELGVGWREGPRAPFRFKAGRGRFEHRLAMDMAGYGMGAPGLGLETKFALLEGRAGGLAPVLMTTIPLGSDVWVAQAGLLGTLAARSGVALRGDLAIQLTEASTVSLPAAVLVDVPVASRWALVMDTSARSLAPTPEGFLVALGTAWRPTDLLTADARVGWDIDAAAPYATVGFATGLGRMR